MQLICAVRLWQSTVTQFVFHKTQTIYDGKAHSLSIKGEEIKAEAQEARFLSHVKKTI